MRKHPRKVVQYTELMNTARSSKRKASGFGTATKPAKQTKLNFNPGNKASQITVNWAILEFIYGAYMPFSIVENPSFCSLIKTLQRNCTVLTRKTVKCKLDDMHGKDNKRKSLQRVLTYMLHMLQQQRTIRHQAQSYIGVTVH